MCITFNNSYHYIQVCSMQNKTSVAVSIRGQKGTQSIQDQHLKKSINQFYSVGEATF